MKTSFKFYVLGFRLLSAFIVLFLATSMEAQQLLTRVTSVNNVSNVASMSYKGTLAIGLPIIGRIENTTTQNTLANNGLWGWETQRFRFGSAAAFQKSKSEPQAPSDNTLPSSASQPLTFRVMDQTGREIESSKYETRPDGSVDLSALSSGVYFVVAFNETQIRSYTVSVLR